MTKSKDPKDPKDAKHPKDHDDRSSQPWRPSRRDFLRYTGITTAALAAAPQFLVACSSDGQIVGMSGVAVDVSNLAVDTTLEIFRREDLIYLRLGLVNLKKVGSPRRLVRINPGPAFLVVTLQGQHILEQTTPYGAAPPALEAPVATLIARDSRLVFTVPASQPDIELSTANILAVLGQLGLNVNANGAGPALDPSAPNTVSGGSAGSTRALDPLETAIELPFRLQLSPNQYGRFAHAAQPMVSRGRYELWHTRLGSSRTAGVPVDERDPSRRSVRALWTRDSDGAAATFESSLSADDRRKIVTASADWGVQANPPAIKVKQLALSALGGFLDAELDVPEGGPTNLERWLHRAGMGRDTRVDVILRGFCFPFGHRMVLLKTSERKFPAGGLNQPAVLYRSKILIVREPLRTYTETHPQLAQVVRQMPFQSVRFLTMHSPNLDGDPDENSMFAPRVGNQPFRFECEGIDRAGRKIRFAQSIVWVPDIGEFPSLVDQMNIRLNSQGDPVTMMRGQRVAFAAPGEADDTSFETTSVTIRGVRVDSPPASYKFYPQMSEAKIAVEAVRAATGVDDPRSFKYAKPYQDYGFRTDGTTNPRQIFLEVVDAGQGVVADFAKQSDKSGGFITPSLEVRGLSRLTGPVSEIGSTADVGPGTAFKTLNGIMPKLFGCVALTDILGSGTIDRMTPRFVSEAFTEAERFLSLGQRLRSGLPAQPGQPGLAGLPGLRDGLLGFSSPDPALNAKATSLRNFATKLVEQLDTTVTALNTLQESVRQNPSLADLEQQVDDALRATSTPAPLTKLHDFALALADPLTGKLGNLLPQLDAALRTCERLVRALDELTAGGDPVALVSRAYKAFLRGLDLVRDGNVRLEWRPPLRTFKPFVPGNPNGLLLSADMRTRSRGEAKAGVDLLCSLENFQLDLEVIKLGFTKLQFRQRAGKKPEIDVIMDGIGFDGILKFVQTLQQIIPRDGFSDPPNVEVSPTGLKAGFSLALPSIAVGVFSLEHMAISAALEVPFLGDALTFRFGFCSRESPFVVTVAMLGGGGFFGVTISPKGLVALEAAIEFGARLSLNLGIASGAVEIMGGIYFSWHEVDGAHLCGYLRIRGEVDVMGLISASIELRLSLDYYPSVDKLEGEALLEIEVSLCFFSTKFSTRCKRQFAGANGDPTFIEVVGALPPNLNDSHPWLDYWETFAA